MLNLVVRKVTARIFKRLNSIECRRLPRLRNPPAAKDAVLNAIQIQNSLEGGAVCYMCALGLNTDTWGSFMSWRRCWYFAQLAG
jgi:hypothetical protein